MASSVLANSRSLAGASKIAPHSDSLLPERCVSPFQFVECHYFSILAAARVTLLGFRGSVRRL